MQTSVRMASVASAGSLWLSRFFVGGLLGALAWAIATGPLEWVALGVAGAILVALVLAEPRWGLYVLPFAVPFGSIREVALGPATVGGTEALLGLFLAAWLARGIARREVRLRRPPLLGAILLWYGVMLLSTLNSLSLAASLKELLKWGETFALYAIAAQELRPRDIAIVVATTLAAGSLAALEGIYQSLFRVGPPGFLFPLAGRIWLRAYGRFIQPNPYAGYLGLVLPLAWGIVVGIRGWGLGAGTAGARGWGLGAGERSTEQPQSPDASHSLPTTYHLPSTIYHSPPTAVSPHHLITSSPHHLLSQTTLLLLAGGAGALIAAALFLTLSRGGWIGAAAAVGGAGVLLSRRAALLSLAAGGALALGVALGGAALLPEALAARATDFLPYLNVWDVDVRGAEITDANFAVIERLAHWQAAYEMWADEPWLGQGVGNYAAVYPAYHIPPWDEPLGHAHNLFLNTLAETGLLGLGAYLLFWGSALGLALRAVWRNAGLAKGLAVGILGAMVHLHAHNFFDNLYVHGMYLHLALLLAMAAQLCRAGVPHKGNTKA